MEKINILGIIPLLAGLAGAVLLLVLVFLLASNEMRKRKKQWTDESGSENRTEYGTKTDMRFENTVKDVPDAGSGNNAEEEPPVTECLFSGTSDPAGTAASSSAPVTDLMPSGGTPPQMTSAISTGVVQGIGARRDQQDSFAVSDSGDAAFYGEKGILAVVADGMGGLANGRDVSELVVRICMEEFQAKGAENISDRLMEIAGTVNDSANRMLQRMPERSGSTMVLALVRQGVLGFLTVGDSRIYLMRGGRLICLNRPHIYEEVLALEAVNGQRSLESVHRDIQREGLTSFIGAGRLKYLDRSTDGIVLTDGDKILLATDGIFGTLTQQQMEQALAYPAQEAASRLGEGVEAAAKAAQDNYTALIMEYHG